MKYALWLQSAIGGQPKFRRGVKYALLKINPPARRKCNPEQATFYGARRSPKGGHFMNPHEMSGLKRIKNEI
jgi:hypothetical protein